MIILGIGAILGDAAAALAHNGILLAAVEQKKIARRLRPGELPLEAIESCLEISGIRPDAVDCVALARPVAPEAQTELLEELRSRFPKARVVAVDHHLAHAASAFYASGFGEATVLTLDRSGDFRCGALWRASGNHLEVEKELYFPDSPGELYGRVTKLLNFEPRADEHKVQWMSAGADAPYVDTLTAALPLDESGWPTKGLQAKLEFPARASAPSIAASLQQFIEQTVLTMAGKGENLCVAGGLFLNAMTVAALERSNNYSRVFVQPAAGNAGTALGALFYAWHEVYGEKQRIPFGDLCLGPEYSSEDIKKVVENCKLRFRYLGTSEETVDLAIANLAQDRIVAWMHGRMEFGPRALGNRSILASPVSPYSTENLNVFIKHREPFRKFAASVPEEEAAKYFEVGENARFLATVGRVKPEYKERFQAAILGEDMIRVHTVKREDNPLYWKLLHAAAKSFGAPVLFNTSFNLFGDPLVCSPRDAVRSFYSSGIDTMFIGQFYLEK